MKLLQTALKTALLLSACSVNCMDQQKPRSYKQSTVAKQEPSHSPVLKQLTQATSGGQATPQAPLRAQSRDRSSNPRSVSVPEVAKLIGLVNSLTDQEAKRYNAITEQVRVLIMMGQEAEEKEKTLALQVKQLITLITAQEKIINVQGTHIAALLAISRDALEPALSAQQLSGLEHEEFPAQDSSSFVPSRLRVWTGTLDAATQDNIWK